jgi:hypothetical protein
MINQFHKLWYSITILTIANYVFVIRTKLTFLCLPPKALVHSCVNSFLSAKTYCSVVNSKTSLIRNGLRYRITGHKYIVRLIICKICGSNSSDYEECHLLWYKNQLRTSQKTHYVSVTETSRLMLCKIWSFHSGGYEELFCDVTPRDSCKNRCFGGTCRLYH